MGLHKAYVDGTNVMFWGTTFSHFSAAARLMEQNATYWQSLPIFGGLFHENLKHHGKRGGSWLSIRNDIHHSEHTNILRVMAKQGLTTISDFLEIKPTLNSSIITAQSFPRTTQLLRKYNLENLFSIM